MERYTPAMESETPFMEMESSNAADFSGFLFNCEYESESSPATSTYTEQDLKDIEQFSETNT